MKKALITGISGQDGSYLAELLLEKGYEVHGIVRRHSTAENQTARIEKWHGHERLHLHYGDITDVASLIQIIKKSEPDELYNVAAQSHVRISFDVPVYTASATGMGPLHIFEAVRIVNPKIKIYQASSSEMFGNSIDNDGYQRETTPMCPVSPYACAKVFAYNIARNYRNSYDMFISNGILFNHESPRRGSNFVTSKIVKGAIAIANKEAENLPLGNLDATRDWGHAKDYVKAMWMMLQQDKPEDYVCATGVSHSVRDCCEYVFGKLNMDYRDYVVLDERFIRPEELKDLKGDSSKLRTELGWIPEYNFETLMDDMMVNEKGYNKTFKDVYVPYDPVR